MTTLILQIFEVLKVHPLLRWISLIVLTVILVLLTTEQSYKEDISDFLPLENEQQKAFMEYQSSSNARRIYVIFHSPNNSCQPAVDLFVDILEATDTSHIIDFLYDDDPEVVQDAMNSIYTQIPYLLTTEDYARIDSLIRVPDFIAHQLENDKQLLMLPSAGMMSLQIQHDPLNLFGIVLERQKQKKQANSCMLLIDSPFGASETENNTKLVSMVQHICDSVNNQFPKASVRLTGGPVIAVGNAQQIKKDSIISITLAVILILILLWLAFRNIRNLLLIAVSIGWGWLFAMGCLTLVHKEVSIIVIGISSVILGIAVNYPLHLIDHLSHTDNIRSALKEIVMPLVVGNITTVGAFLALLPLESVALRDLGLFSSFLLIGTIIFVLLWLPHMIRQVPKTTRNIWGRISDVQVENKSWTVWAVVVLTVMLGYFSFQTSFDADLRNINYMTDEQKNDMRYLEHVTLFKSVDSDVKRWNEWCMSKGKVLCQQLREESNKRGFAEDSFDEFYKLVHAAPTDETQSLTSAIVNNLSGNFNYIGWACGFIVFFFLWFSLGSIELALISFLPMAVSWIWILGIMSLLGIQFNVVNIILATFIFGQGDDYTIFMTEGCQYEYAYRRKMLSSYKHSIILSALIMFIGIGALIIAKHPALYSLAEVTIIGMFSVVLMAYLFPPLLFRCLVYSHGKERLQPLTIKNFVKRKKIHDLAFVSDCYRYRGVEIITAVNNRLRKYKNRGYFQLIDDILLPSTRTIVFINSGWGELVFYYAILRPNIKFVSIDKDFDKSCVARNVAENRVSNISFVDKYSCDIRLLGKINSETQTILLDPTDDDIKDYSFLNPIIVK